MHSCKETKEQLTELVLDGLDYRSNDVLSAELKGCCECRAEFDALNAALRITTRQRETAAPSESYWTSYHAKLRQKLETTGHEPIRFSGPSLLTRFLKYSVPVPAPLGVALIIACAVLIPLSIRGALQQTRPAQNATIVRVPIEVPVIQEKIVTRVVYHNRSSRAGS